MSIVVEKVTKFYGSEQALNEVSFSIAKGEIAGFIGPNGAGKTTMMKILTGILPYNSGKVTIEGKEIDKDPLEIKRMIGYLPENNPLYTHMYIKEYLQFVAGLYQLGKSTKGRVDEVIQRTGLTGEVKKKISELSKGYRQRVGLASALVHDPEVLILDEPTTGLDPNQILEIRNLISEIGKEKTVMLSTHIMQEVEAICNRVIIINKGKIASDEKPGIYKVEANKNKQVVVVEFNKKLSPVELQKIESVIKVISTKDNCWLIEGESSEDLREKIFRFAVENNVSVLSMQRQEKSLEEVFRELTR
jgi:ABC-2 type transport system ATP-binding protein